MGDANTIHRDESTDFVLKSLANMKAQTLEPYLHLGYVKIKQIEDINVLGEHTRLVPHLRLQLLEKILDERTGFDESSASRTGVQLDLLRQNYWGLLFGGASRMSPFGSSAKCTSAHPMTSTSWLNTTT